MKEIVMPPSRACEICKNRMNQVCLEECALKKDYRHFDPKMDIAPDTLPELTLEEYRELNGRMKGEWLFVMLKKLREVLNGTGNYSYRARGRRISQNLKSEGLLLDPEEGNTVYQASEKCKDKVE